MNPICLIGASGYIGSEFARQLKAREWPTMIYGHEQIHSSDQLHGFSVVINCAAFIPQPSVSACDNNHRETFKGNVFLPGVLAYACEKSGIPLMHLSTGCLYDEAGDYAETEAPLRGWKDHCGYYVGTKLMAEEIVAGYEKHWIARIRLPFDEQDNPRNYLSKLIQYPQVYDHVNSLCHRADIVSAMLDMIESRVPFGLYNLCNTGHIAARSIVNKMSDAGIINAAKEYVPGPCKGTRLSNTKLLSCGINIRPVEEAVDDSIKHWIGR